MDNQTYLHLAAYRGSVLTATTNTAIAGVADSILAKASSGAFLVPKGLKAVRWGVAGGVNASRSRIDTPVVRAVGLPYIAPLNTGVTAPSPPNVADFSEFGIRPAPADELSVQATHTDAGTQVQFALLGLQFGYKAPTPGQRYRVRGTAAITGVVGSWANGAITLDQTLPAGVYEIVGMDAFGTNLLGARLIFAGGGWRPGVLARNAVNSIPNELFLDGDVGAMGQFDSVTLPQLEIYVEAANSAQEIYWDLVRVGDR